MWSPRLIRRRFPVSKPGREICCSTVFRNIFSPSRAIEFFQFTGQSVFRPYMYRGNVVIKINKKKLHGVIIQNSVIILEYSLCKVVKGGYAVEQLVEALRYKSESRGCDSRCHWNFPLT